MTAAPAAVPAEQLPAPDPAPGYWTEADAAGLTVRRGGHRLVVGSCTDALSTEPGLFVEYADPGAFTDGTLEAVLADLAGRHPGSAVFQVRTPAGTRLPPPWRRSLTYVRLTRPLTGRPRPDGLRIVAATEEHQGPVRVWTARAIRQGADEQGRQAAEDDIAAAAAEVLDARPTVLVAVLDGAPVGHAVLLDEQADAVTAAAHTELWDVLVEPDAPHAGACRDALVAAAAAHAAGRGLPLLGHVVHRSDESRSAALTALQARGWSTDHILSLIHI